MREVADLLHTARATLLEELLPALPEAQRYAARMVANALAIAARAVTAAPVAEVPPALCQEIRAGKCDPGTPDHDAVAARLVAATQAHCAVSNPKAL